MSVINLVQSSGISAGSFVTANKPLDAKMIAQYRSDLTSNTEWLYHNPITDRDVDLRYSGMIVSVINDQQHLNGVYYLPKLTKRNCYAEIVNPSEQQDNQGWTKLGSGSSNVVLDNYTIKDNLLSATDDDVRDQPGLHVVRVDGGWF